MSQREAAVKLTLDGAQFSVSIKRVGDEVDKMAVKGKKAMSTFSAGMGAAKRSMMDLGGAAKNTLKMVASFGGAFAVGNAIKGAVELQGSYSTLAFRIQTATDKMVHAADVQKIIERSASQTSRTNEEMAESFSALFAATGDLDFSRDVLAAIGTTATATGAELGTLTTLADQLHTKFDVSADAMQGAFARVFEHAQRGGPAFNEFADVMSNVGAELLAAGLEGEQGLDFMLGALVKTDDRLKSLPAQVKGLKAVLRGLGDQSELKKLAAKLGIDSKKLINEKDAIARLRRILGTGKKGVDALMSSMNEGEEKETMKILFTDPFEQALAKAQTAGLKGKAAIDNALMVLESQIENFGEANLTGAALQKEANRKALEPAALLRTSLDNLNKAFASPEIIQGINDLAKHLPALAKTVGDVVQWIAKNPILSAALGVGAKAATAVVPAVIGAGLKAALGGGAAAVGSAAAGGAAAVGGGAAVGGVGAAGAVGLAAVAVPAAIIAAIGVGGLLIGEQIKKAFDEEADVMKELANATAAGFGGGSLEQQKASLARLQKASKAVDEADVGEGIMDSVSRGVLANAGAPDSRKQAADQMKLAGEAIAQRHMAIQKLEAEQAKQAAAPAAVAAAAAAAPAGKPATVQIDPSNQKTMGAAMATALGGQVLTVRLLNPGEVGVPRATAASGSRGPMTAPRSAPGGGH